MRLKLVPPSTLRKLRNRAKVNERDKYPVLPRRSPRQHQASLAADQYRRQFHSNTTFLHHTQGVFFKISISGYAIIDYHACTASHLYPLGDSTGSFDSSDFGDSTDSFDSSNNPAVPDSSDSSVTPTDWIRPRNNGPDKVRQRGPENNSDQLDHPSKGKQHDFGKGRHHERQIWE
jgi:hypothetical protein